MNFIKTIFTATAFISAATALHAEVETWQSADNKTAYTFSSLSSIDGAGVTKEGNSYTLSKNLEFGATDTLRLDNNATVKFGEGVMITVKGYGDFAPLDTAVITRAADSVKTVAIYFSEPNTSNGVFKNVTFKYVSMRYAGYKPLQAENCSWISTTGIIRNSTNQSAINFFTTTGQNSIKNCRFISNQGPAVSAPANITTPVRIENCYFYDNNTANSNKPQLNLTVGGDGAVEIIGNTMVGTRRTMVGAIAVSNLLNIEGTHNVLIEGNDIRNHRYGITATSRMSVVIKNNTLIDNNAETNAMNGGSGINVYDPYYYQTCRIEGNHIEGHLWGITIIGGKDVNAGKVADKTAADYNPGGNVFKNNGNGGVLYDLYNNGKNDVYAQGNTWNVAEQTEVEIAKVVYDKTDDSKLGTVYFMPAGGSGSVAPASKVNDSIVYNKESGELILATTIDVQIYDITGKYILGATDVNRVDLNSLAKGIYIVRTDNGTAKIVR